MGRAERISAVIRRYDPMLYCESREGKLCVFRKSQRIESYEIDGMTIQFVRPAPFFVFALTQDWRLQSEETEWGIEPIMKRIKEIDLWKRDLAGEIIQNEEKHSEIAKKDFKNESEAFLKDYRKTFARAFNDTRVANKNKIDKRKLGEKNGNC